MFKFKRHQFFSSLCNDEVQPVCPPVDATLQFWSKLWGEPCQYDSGALPDLKDLLNISNIPAMDEPIISSELFTYVVKNWNSPGLDCLHGYWIKHLTSLHDHLRYCLTN